MSLNKIGNFIGFDESFDEAMLVIFGAPFDGTTSFRPGTRFGPNVMRLESDGIETYSPYVEKDLEDYALHDAGDLDFPFGNRDETLKAIENYTRSLISKGKIPLMIGGEHLVSYPAVKAVFEKYKDLRIIHLDAHADLRQDYLGEELSHATVMRRIWDLVGDNNIYQFGIRSGEREEFKWAKNHVCIQKFNLDGVDDLINTIGDQPVYVTIDLDVLDPSIFPGTGTPEAGGISFNELLKAIRVFQGLNIVGADIVELSPHYDQTGVSTAVACKVLRELVLAIL